MKKFLLIIFVIMITGCTNEKEEVLNEYVAMKGNLLEEDVENEEELPLDIVINVDRIGEELINYQVVIDNPDEDMYNIKSMVVHNYYSEELYPTIGVFDETQELLKDENDAKIQLTGTIKTTKNISNINLGFKLWLEYTNYLGEKKEIYYKTT